MWRKVLSWTALVANILAVLINLGLLVYVGLFQERQTHISLLAEAIGLIIVGGFLLSGPVISIFAIIFGAPLRRPPSEQTPLVASAFD
jgi:hypothetical protein